ncbi:MAG: sugar phosphate nucleotidyltransferase [Bacillota bacterium]|nr:sugar phosphate nucleotidyltransferase [Bacillota bacterium]
MNKKLLGIIDATNYHEDLQELLTHRSMAALPFGGRYRIIDFVLSNMVNSGMNSVAIFPKLQYRSLMDHLGSGKNWGLNRKRDGLFFFPCPQCEYDHKRIGSFHHFAANLDFFHRSTQEYSLITNCFTVFNMDFRPLLEWHIQSGCDITTVHDKNGKALDIYLVKTSLLMELVQTRNETRYTCMEDVVNDPDPLFVTCHYKYNGYAEVVDSIQSYFKTSMDLLKPAIWTRLFLKDWPILTKVKDEPPAKYTRESTVQNSMVANGCTINGNVENSIISRGVQIGKGAVIRNCIIMQKCQIGENSLLDSVILDKDVKIEAGTVLTGTPRFPYVVPKGRVQGALMKS